MVCSRFDVAFFTVLSDPIFLFEFFLKVFFLCSCAFSFALGHVWETLQQYMNSLRF